MKHLFLSLALIAPAVMSAVNPQPVNPPAEIPAGISSVSPTQGFINTSGDANPLGVGEITLTFGSSEIIANSDVHSELYKNGELYKTSTRAYADAMGTPMGSVNFGGAVTGGAWYEVRIPEGQFTVAGQPSPAVTLFYEIFQFCTISPQPGVVDEMSEISLYIHDVDKVEIKESLLSEVTCLAHININGAEVSPEYKVTPSVVNDGREWAVFLNISDGDGIATSWIYTGNYLFNIPEGLIRTYVYGDNYDNDPEDYVMHQNPRYNFEYIIPSFPSPAIEPATSAPVVGGFKDFVLKMPTGFEVAYADNMTNSYVYPVDEDNQVDYNNRVLTVRAGATAVDKTARTITLNVIENWQPVEQPVTLEPGYYALVLADRLFAGSWSGTQKFSAPYRYDYEVIATSSVEDAGLVMPETYNVYNLQGVRVARNASKDALNSLPAGLYIANGKKVVVR